MRIKILYVYIRIFIARRPPETQIYETSNRGNQVDQLIYDRSTTNRVWSSATTDKQLTNYSPL